jgi:hypothetical protein
MMGVTTGIAKRAYFLFCLALDKGELSDGLTIGPGGVERRTPGNERGAPDRSIEGMSCAVSTTAAGLDDMLEGPSF